MLIKLSHDWKPINFLLQGDPEKDKEQRTQGTSTLLGGYGYRSTGHNINGQNINELQINCSVDQRKPVDV